MLHSMTGYGEATHEDERIRVGFRIKTVNNRGLDLNIKLPFDFMYLESEIRAILKETCFRGRVDVFSEIEIRDPGLRPPTPLNRARMTQLTDLCGQLKKEFQVQGELDINSLLNLPDLTVAQRVGYRLPEPVEQVLLEIFRQATYRLLDSRLREGRHIRDDLLARLSQLREEVHAIDAMGEQRQDELRDQIRKRVETLMDDNNLDEARLGLEIVYYADRLDVSEEITRLKAHLDTNEKLLNSDKRPLGKELDFLLQEQLREVTTIGNKAKHLGMAEIVVKLKTGYEKVREQTQNVE